MPVVDTLGIRTLHIHYRVHVAKGHAKGLVKAIKFMKDSLVP